MEIWPDVLPTSLSAASPSEGTKVMTTETTLDEDILSALESVPGVGSLKMAAKTSPKQEENYANKQGNEHNVLKVEVTKVEMNNQPSGQSLSSSESTRGTDVDVVRDAVRRERDLHSIERVSSSIQRRPLPDLPLTSLTSRTLTRLEHEYDEPHVSLTLQATLVSKHSVSLSVNSDKLALLERQVHAKHHDRCFCGLQRGPHILILSLLALPILFLFSIFSSLLLATFLWYNVLLRTLEARNACLQLLAPILVLIYPLYIVTTVTSIAICASLASLSWYWHSWLEAWTNPDRGIFANICKFCRIADCCPYQVVLIEDRHHNTL